jgi:predicted Ser/Thr protein kinase
LPFTPPPLPEISALFPQLEIVELLGRGGMGAVYKARQPAIDRWVALKVLPPQATARPGFAERFNREARALARLNHPNIVALHEFGQVGGMPYFVMEYVEGLTLRRLVQSGRLEPRQALGIVPQICEALQFAHDEGVVHRDIKPENILIDKKGRVKIADFGIAKIMGGTSPTALPASNREGRRNETEPGKLTQDQVLGTPNYMAPEQQEHPERVDHRADIYSLGVVFYEMLTGELPLGKFAPPSLKVEVDVRLDEVVLHALEKEPDRRYQQAKQVKSAVETIAATSAPGGAQAHASASALGAENPVGPWSWLETARWSARLLGLSLLLFVMVIFGLFLFGVGLPPLALQSADTLLKELAIVLAVLGFILGWRYEGTAAVFITAGWVLWHVSNGSLAWSMFHIALLVAGLYAGVWWVTQGRRTAILVAAAAILVALLAGGLLLRPTPIAFLTARVKRGPLTKELYEAGRLMPATNDTTRWRIEVDLPETIVSDIEVGREAVCVTDAYPDRSFKGTVIEVGNEPRQVQNTTFYRAVVEADAPGLKLRWGMSVRLAFIIDHRQDTLKIPCQALEFDMPGRPVDSTESSVARSSGESAAAGAPDRAVRTVWRMRPSGQPEPVQIRIGISDNASIEVLSGLNEGDLVVIGKASPKP